jgi:replicative DNA helicase
MKLATALELLKGVTGSGEDSQWKALCPAHDDRNPSLSVGVGNKHRILLSCHAGCTYNQIRGALLDRLPDRIEYEYHDADGEWVGSAVKQYTSNGEKRFHQRGPDGTRSNPTLKATPYRLPDLLSGIARGDVILVVEGEKDADTLSDLGKTATCNIGGAGKWRDTHSGWLSGAEKVFIIADNDAPGLKHAEAVRESVRRICPEVRVAVFTPRRGKDITEHLLFGGKLSELDRVADPSGDSDGVTADEIDGWPFVDADSFVFDTPDEVPAIWGTDGKKVLWAKGQGLIVLAPQGVGKTTLALRLVEARLGLSEEVLEIPCVRASKNVGYMAMDRPQQIAGAMKRAYWRHGRVLHERGLRVLTGPPPQDLARNPEFLVDVCMEMDLDTVFVDSLKDGVMGLSNDEVAQGWNKAVQLCLREGIEVCVLHHPPKRAGSDPERAMDNDDAYGSTWLTAGMGSVLQLWAKADSAYVELTQTKFPVGMLPPLLLRRNNAEGTFEVIGGSADWQWFFKDPHTVGELAAHMFEGEVSGTNLKKARRVVDDLVARELLEKHSEDKSGNGRPAVRYILVGNRNLS